MKLILPLLVVVALIGCDCNYGPAQLKYGEKVQLNVTNNTKLSIYDRCEGTIKGFQPDGFRTYIVDVTCWSGVREVFNGDMIISANQLEDKNGTKR